MSAVKSTVPESHIFLQSDVNTALLRSTELDFILQECTAAVVQRLGAAFARIWTLNQSENVLELRASAGMYTHLDGPHSRIEVGKFKIGLIAQERKPHLTNEVLSDPRISDKDWAGKEGMVAFAGYPLIVDDSVIGVIAMFSRQPLAPVTLKALETVAQGITLGITRKRSEQSLQQALRISDTLRRIGIRVAAELDLETLVQVVTDEATKLVGADFGAFFYNVITPTDEILVLYTLSGAPREAFSKFPMPRNTAVFHPTFSGEATVRSDDIRKDPRYGRNPPFHGMPQGHLPVVSYLAVPVVSRSGEVIGGLFFGHKDTGAFTAEHEELVTGVAAQAAIAIDNARLFEKARRSEDRFSSLVLSTTSIVWTANSEGVFVSRQPAWEEYTGQTYDEYKGDGSANAVHPDDRSALLETWREAVRQCSVYTAEARLWNAARAEYRYVLIKATPVLEKDQSVREWIGTNTDIHDERAARQALEERTRELEEAVKELESFSYSVSHDLRAPLRSIDAFASILDDEFGDLLPDEGKKYLQTIQQSSTRMNALISDLLQFSRLGRQPVSRQNVNLEELAISVWQELSPETDGRRITIQVKDMPPAHADAALLRHVLVNLLGNAIKYTRTREHANIELDASVQGPETVYCVRDNGVGFNNNYAHQLFDVFVRLHDDGEFEGTGVGLAIVQRVINRHGGRVWAQGNPGQGAEFYFTLGSGS